MKAALDFDSDIKLKKVIERLIEYIRKEEYKGYDPYDLLNSPLFKLPVLRSNKKIRFYSQQIFRRVPINLRPFLGIKKEINPVTLGLAIQSYTYLIKAEYPGAEELYKDINFLIDKLIELRSKGYSGYCWGYNFDWEARYARIPKFCPTIVATGIITNGLYEYWKFTNDKRVKEILISSSSFVLNDLNRSYEGDTFCFSYSPNDYQKVYNATMKGARLLAQVYSITKDEKLIQEAEKTVKFVINNQNEDGSWYYSKGDARKWIDNFHTAYVLDCLLFYNKVIKSFYVKKSLDKASEFYFNNFFVEKGVPKYYLHSFYPIDATELSQSIITSINFGRIDFAEKIINFIINSFSSDNHIFYYRISRFYKINIPYMRWSLIWMLLAFSKYYWELYDLD